MNSDLIAKLHRARRIAFGIGSTGLIACFIGFVVDRQQAAISYLTAYLFWIGLSLGCLGVAMIHHLTAGGWGFVTRRILEAAFMVLPIFAILFLPVLLNLPELYPWARPGAATSDPKLLHKAAYLNQTGFWVRALFCLGLWMALAVWLRKWSLQQDTVTDVSPTLRLRTLSGLGIVLYPLTATFALIDWVMSTEARWSSTIFPLIILIGQILTAFALITLLLIALHNHPPLNAIVERKHFRDLGNLLLAFVIFWTYVSFSQFLIIYSGNLPREIDWYLHRVAGGWKWIVALLALFHFFIPFFLLMVRVMKQNVRRLAIIAALILGIHTLEVFWVVQPAFFPTGPHLHWLDLAAFIGLGGIWSGCFLQNLSRSPLLPRNDPRIEYPNLNLAHANQSPAP